ncbi:MAG: polysaccharide biosynthesis tyrosine autokinase [Candidatus Firestonebacteria bacterium]
MAHQELTLSDYWKIFNKRKYVIVFSIVLMLMSTYIFTMAQKTIYKAQTLIKIDVTNVVPGTDPIDTEIRIAKSREVVEIALETLKIPETVSEFQDEIECEQVVASNRIQITAYASNAKDTVKKTNAIANAYIKRSMEQRNKAANDQKQYIAVQLEQQKIELSKAEEKLRDFKAKGNASGMATAYASKLIDLNSDLAGLLNSYTEEHPEVVKRKAEIKYLENQVKTLSQQDLELIRMMREVSIIEVLYSNLRKKYQEAEINEAGKIQSAVIESAAQEPKNPVKPNKKLNMIIGGFLGFIIGSIIIFILESFDTSIANVEDLEAFMEIPVLGLIPHAGENSERRGSIFSRMVKRDDIKYFRDNFISWHSKKSILVESYHTLRTNVYFNMEKDGRKSLFFASSGPGEGKTFNAVNFALSVAESGKRVVLIESDLRRPIIHRLLGLKREDGLTDIILGNINWSEGLKGTPDLLMGGFKFDDIIKIPGMENLKIITCGTVYSNPIDLINSDKIEKLISDLKNNFDILVFDCPPVLLFADATIMASKVDASILVYQSGKTSKIALKRAKTQLDNVNSKILGIVLNDANLQLIPYYGSYYYSSRYYKEKDRDS